MDTQRFAEADKRSNAAPRSPWRRSAARRRLQSSAAWVAYFRRNGEAQPPHPWEGGAGLSARERTMIAASVQEFQLGENSAGRKFRRVGAAYARAKGDADYEQALNLFLAEEGRHAAILGRILDLAGIPRRRKTLVDSVFRLLRKPGGLEISIMVTLTAELVAQVYYAALHNATGSPLLRSVCRAILRDEVPHVRFQAERLALLRQSRTNPARWLAIAVHRALLAAALVAIWRKHGRVFRAGGYGFRLCFAVAMRRFRHAAMLMDPTQYDWATQRGEATNSARHLVESVRPVA